MANNTTLNAGSGGDTIRDIDKGGVKTPVVTLDLGGSGAESLIAGAMPCSQSGSWTVTADAGTGTMAVSAASLPLPSGAATSAKQPALGTAGSAASDVITIQGIASMTAVKVDGSAVTQPVSIASAVTVAQATASSLNATVVGTGTFVVQAQQSGTWNARAQDGSGNALTSLSVGAQRSLTVAIVDASGNQVTSFGGSGGTASNYGSAFPATGTGAGYSDGTNMQGARVFDLDAGAGTEYSLGVGIRLSANGGSVEGGTSSHPIRTDPTGTTTQPVSGTITANAGSGTMAVSAASLPLPSGAATSAKQPALGTAGSASADVLTVQGIASMTALKVDGSAVTQPVSIASAVTVAQATASSLNATVVGTGTFATQATLQAGTALVGKVSASTETSTIYNGTTALTPKFAAIAASSSGATTVVAAVGGKKIRVLRWSLSSNGAVNVKWQSHVTPTDLTGLHYLTQYASAGGAYCPVGIFETVSGEALDINLSGAIAVGGELTYIEV